MKPPFLDIIPHRFRRRSLGVTLSVFTRALLNFAGLAVLIPVLVIILDTEGIRSNRWLAALYDFGGFTSDRTFILTVCACVVAVILFKSLANLALYKIERNFIYDLYRELSRRLYVDYRNRGLGFIKSSNSAVLARNVNVVCLTFVTGVLMPVAAMASEAVLFALLFGSLAIYNPLVALLTLAIFVPSVALYYYLVRQRLNRYGEEENRAQRRKSRTVIETFGQGGYRCRLQALRARIVNDSFSENDGRSGEGSAVFVYPCYGSGGIWCYGLLYGAGIVFRIDRGGVAGFFLCYRSGRVAVAVLLCFRSVRGDNNLPLG